MDLTTKKNRSIIKIKLEKFKQNLNKLGYKTALYSLVIGSTLLLLYLVLRFEVIAVVGYFYLITAIVINLIIAFILFVQAITIRKDTSKNLGTIALMLCNIPIAYLYVFLVFDVIGI